MTVTIGGRGNKSSSLSASSVMASDTSALTYSVLNPNSSATRLMVSASNRWLMETITPMFIQVAITLFTGTSIMRARSFAVTNSVMRRILLSFFSCSSLSCSLSSIASRFSLRHFALFFLRLVGKSGQCLLDLFLTSSSLTSGLIGRFNFGDLSALFLLRFAGSSLFCFDLRQQYRSFQCRFFLSRCVCVCVFSPSAAALFKRSFFVPLWFSFGTSLLI